MQIVIDTKGTTLTKRKNAFYIESGDRSKYIGASKISSIAITSDCLISAGAIKLAAEKQIPILLFDHIGKAKARLWSPYFVKLATLRRKQVKFAETTDATQWIVRMFELKTQHQIDNLHYLKMRKGAKKAELDASVLKMKTQLKTLGLYEEQLLGDCSESMMGVEGSIARIYWQTISTCLPEEWQFERRSRQPAEDGFNAALNYLYGMTYTIVEQAIFAAGLDPQMGLLHADTTNKATLSFDLIEAFRPWIDRLLIQACLANKIEKRFFSANKHGVFLNKHGKAFIIPLFNDFLRKNRVFQQRQTHNKNHIFYFAGLLSNRIQTVIV